MHVIRRLSIRKNHCGQVRAILLMVSVGTQAQLAKRSNLTFKEVQGRVNSFLCSDDPLAKDSITWKAKHLVENDKEDYILRGRSLYSFLGNMQAAVDKYKDDDQVEFLFINTWEREANYKEKVKDFFDEKGYDFHVVYDKMEGLDALVSQYGIEGIPTKIIIDPSGCVRFQSAGGSSDVQAVVDEVSYKIELIRESGE